MGVETAARPLAPLSAATTLCVCGERAAALRCADCALAYCSDCSARRHRHGAFARHALAALPASAWAAEQGDDRSDRWPADDDDNNSRRELKKKKAPSAVPCDECDAPRAAVACDACELRFCHACADAVHAHGSMRRHAADGALVDLRPQDDDDASEDKAGSQRHVAQVVDNLFQDDTATTTQIATAVKSPSSGFASSSLKHASSPFFSAAVGRHLLDDDLAAADPDQELSPTPPAKASPPPSDSSTASSSSYDLWGTWSVRAFSERSSLTSPPPLSGSTDWRAFRSLSIDESPASPSLSLHEDDESSSLNSISKSLRSMSFAPKVDGIVAQPEKRAPRPRSFSDYTSLGSVKLNDIWNERVPQLEAQAPKLSVGEELYRSMKTTVASRHVIIRNHAGTFNASSLRRVIDTLGAYGPIASIREEFTGDGMLFCTFFQLKAAIGAVKLWFTNNKTRSGANMTSAYFSVPYEAPNEINCATLLVHVHGPALMGAFSDMRQVCSRYGEVASVLERDGDEMGLNPFLVEYNDARDVATALARLSGVLLPNGQMVSVTRSHPPTFDSSKIQAFQEYVDALPVPHAPLSFTNRPKSFSESTSILTSPSSTSSSSPLHGSFFETRSSGFRQLADSDVDLTVERSGIESFNESSPNSRSTSPFTPPLAPAGNAWRAREAARPRSSSAFASLSTDSSSAHLAEAFPSPPVRPARYPQQYSSPYQPTSGVPSGMHHSQQTLNSHTLMMQGRAGPIRSGSDPGFRASYAGSTTSSTSSIGRNDQGTGEYSLSIEKVAAGEDKRTTLMVRNIPNKYTQQMLLAEINEHHHGKYDFFYLPIDFKNKCNMGYAFINFIEPESIVSFYQEFDSQKWTNFNSEKVCAISYARLQGKQAMITRFQNSSLLEKHESYRPLVFFSSGPNQGRPEPFPSPKPQHQHQHLHHQHSHQHHQYAHQFANKKLHHQHQHHSSPHHSQMMMGSANDEYAIAAQTGRLYAHQQQQQLHHAAHVLHGHALLANAHAAAAAMLHTMPALGMHPPQYSPPPRSSVHYTHGYPQQQQMPVDRRHGPPPYMNGMPARSHSAFGSFSGTNYSSSSSQS